MRLFRRRITAVIVILGFLNGFIMMTFIIYSITDGRSILTALPSRHLDSSLAKSSVRKSTGPKLKPMPNSSKLHNTKRRNPAQIVSVQNNIQNKAAEDQLMKDIKTYDFHQSIPKILHQIYRDTSIPDLVTSAIQSWIKHNPDFKYYFWDDESARKFIRIHYPQFLQTYDGYCHDLYRSDALRYFLLHHYGGIYADLDYDCFKPFYDSVSGYSCHLVQENQPQSRLIWELDDMLQNSLMASAPGHPFMKYLTKTLGPHPNSTKCSTDHVLHTTGPWFLYNKYKRYNELTSCRNKDCRIHILPYESYMPGYDMHKGAPRYYHAKCRWRKTTKERKKACDWFRPKLRRIPDFSRTAVANHRFLHLGYQAKDFKSDIYIPIDEIVPEVMLPMAQQ